MNLEERKVLALERLVRCVEGLQAVAFIVGVSVAFFTIKTILGH